MKQLDCEFGRPLALEAVFEDAVQSGKLVDVREFLASKESLYRKRWVPTVGEVVGWGLRQLGLKGRGALVKGGFVVVGNVEVSLYSSSLGEVGGADHKDRRLRKQSCHKLRGLPHRRARGYFRGSSSRTLLPLRWERTS